MTSAVLALLLLNASGALAANHTVDRYNTAMKKHLWPFKKWRKKLKFGSSVSCINSLNDMKILLLLVTATAVYALPLRRTGEPVTASIDINSTVVRAFLQHSRPHEIQFIYLFYPPTTYIIYIFLLVKAHYFSWFQPCAYRYTACAERCVCTTAPRMHVSVCVVCMRACVCVCLC